MIAKGKRIVAFAVVLCLLLCLLPGCGDQPTRVAYVLPESFESVPTQTVAENDNYTLEWNDDNKAIMLFSKTGEKVWGTMPDVHYEKDDANQFTGSPISIEVVESKKLAALVSRAYTGSIKEGNLSAKLIDNGIEVVYYFDQFHISIPVQFTLRDDSVAVSVDTSRIAEDSEFLLKAVTLAPYMCSVANIEPIVEEEVEDDFDDELFDDELLDDELFDDELLDDELLDDEPAEEVVDDRVPLKDSYLFVPVGNGALVSPALKEDKREYQTEVYGTDGSRYQPYEYYKEENVKMPVIGAKDRDNAIVGIMESGAEQGVVEFSAGNSSRDYSNVAATFYVRGFDIYADAHSYSSTITTRVSKTMVDNTLTVGFYPLTGEEADYVGMANKYREYLVKNGMVKSEVAQSAYALSILGNLTTQSLAFGVPYQSTKSMTTFNEAADIIKELAADTKINPAVQLKGYSQSGLDIGQVAGGFGFARVSGKKKEYAALTEYAASNNIALFTDFDLVFFNSAGNGFNKMFSVAKTATLHKSELYHRMLALRAEDEDKGAYHLLSRAQLAKAMSKLLRKGDNLNISGFSFSTLGTVAYSDYADEAYEVKKGMGVDVQSLFASANDAGHTVATDNANDYAAMVSDSVFNVEIEPRYTDVFDVYVPFYQIVFKGYVPLYSEALNLTYDYDTSVLSALASGTGLGYTLLKNYDASYAASVQTNLHSSLYSANKELITQTAAKYADYYAAIKEATIKDYEVLENGVSVTTFDNGVIAYTNPSNEAQAYPGGELAAMGFKYVKGGAN